MASADCVAKVFRTSRWVAMTDRVLVLSLTAALLAAPLAAQTQGGGKVPRIGVLVPVEPESPTEPNVAAFRQALRNLGYVEGQTVSIEYVYAHGEGEPYPKLAAELVRRQVDVMVVGSALPTRAARNATRTMLARADEVIHQ